MTLRHLKIFCAVCDHNFNTTKAATYMSMTQPAVSLAIKELENYYGVVLFDRINKRLSITSVGESFLQYAKRICNMFEDMELGLKDWDYFGKIRVGANLTAGTHFLPHYVKEFSELHPDVKVEVYVAPKKYVLQKLLDNQLDFALIESENDNPLIETTEYMNDSLVVVCPADKYADKTTISKEEFISNPLLLRTPGSSVRQVFDSVCNEAGLSPKPLWESTCTSALFMAVESGLGITVLPYPMIAPLAPTGRFSTVNVDGLNFEHKYYIYVHKDKYLSRSAKDFIEICKTSEANTRYENI